MDVGPSLPLPPMLPLFFRHFRMIRRRAAATGRHRTVILVATGLLACGDAPVIPTPTVVVAAVGVDDGPRILERGERDTVTATALEADGDTVVVPVVWRSSNERVAVFERGGVLVALDTGITIVTASTLGVTSAPTAFAVVWLGPAYIDTISWTPPHALSPGAALSDSVRVRVLNIDSIPVTNARVAFRVTSGGGSVSPMIATTDLNGEAAARWTLGPAIGLNEIVASVVRADSTPNPFVADNAATFSLTAYEALSVNTGGGQSGQILSDLPVAPSVKLVDSLGNARAGVPVTFVAFSGGRVATPTVSTNAAGIATPGTWTLGDEPGEQRLEARVADARVTLTATATGTPIRYLPAGVSAGRFSNCALEMDGAVKCWGEIPQIGTGGSNNVSSPTPVSGGLIASLLAGGSTHYCAVDPQMALWCWGNNALVDTSGATVDAAVPTRLPSDLTWKSVSPGFSHNCAIDSADVTHCWGNNAAGQLGDGGNATRFAPASVAGGFTFTRISAGTAHTCALTAAGSAFCWGSNQVGQLGDGTQQARPAPTAVAGGHSFQAIGAGETFTCGLRTDGRVYCWGALAAPVQLTPRAYPEAPAFTALSVGDQHACALTADGTAYCWGANEFGRLGDSTTTARELPTRVAGDLRFSEVSAGYRHTCSRTTQGAVACWGQNRGGELGDPSFAFHLTPRYLVLGVTP